jgi:hypothetical protein
MFPEVPVFVCEQHLEKEGINVRLHHRQPPSTISDRERAEQKSIAIDDLGRRHELAGSGYVRKISPGRLDD